MSKEDFFLKRLTNIANDFMKSEFNTTLDIPLKLNGRFTTCLGRFSYKTYFGKADSEHKIELAKDLLEYYSFETAIDVLKHELVHYGLYKKGLPHQDKDKTFKDFCNARGISLSHTIRQGYKFVYTCSNGCLLETSRKKKKNFYCSHNLPYIYSGKRRI